MKEVKRIDEWTTNDGAIVEVEIIFVDGSKVKYTIENDTIKREGNL